MAAQYGVVRGGHWGPARLLPIIIAANESTKKFCHTSASLRPGSHDAGAPPPRAGRRPCGYDQTVPPVKSEAITGSTLLATTVLVRMMPSSRLLLSEVEEKFCEPT